MTRGQSGPGVDKAQMYFLVVWEACFAEGFELVRNNMWCFFGGLALNLSHLNDVAFDAALKQKKSLLILLQVKYALVYRIIFLVACHKSQPT